VITVFWDVTAQCNGKTPVFQRNMSHLSSGHPENVGKIPLKS